MAQNNPTPSGSVKVRAARQKAIEVAQRGLSQGLTPSDLFTDLSPELDRLVLAARGEVLDAIEAILATAADPDSDNPHQDLIRTAAYQMNTSGGGQAVRAVDAVLRELLDILRQPPAAPAAGVMPWEEPRLTEAGSFHITCSGCGDVCQGRYRPQAVDEYRDHCQREHSSSVEPNPADHEHHFAARTGYCIEPNCDTDGWTADRRRATLHAQQQVPR